METSLQLELEINFLLTQNRIQSASLSSFQNGPLSHHLNVMWSSRTASVVVPMFTKWEQSVCSNFQGVTLLSFNGKAFAEVLEMRWRVIGEPQIHEADCAVHPVQVQGCWSDDTLMEVSGGSTCELDAVLTMSL